MELVGGDGTWGGGAPGGHDGACGGVMEVMEGVMELKEGCRNLWGSDGAHGMVELVGG